MMCWMKRSPVLIGLATHLDEFAPQTVRSLADARMRTRTFWMCPGEPGKQAD
jgi:hypothetical protein